MTIGPEVFEKPFRHLLVDGYVLYDENAPPELAGKVAFAGSLRLKRFRIAFSQ